MCDSPGYGILAWLLKSCLNAPEAVSFESQRRTTQDELGYRTAGEDCWGRKRNIYQAHQQTWLYMKDHIKPLRNHKKKLIPRVLFVAEEAYRPPLPFFQFNIFKFSSDHWDTFREKKILSREDSILAILKFFSSKIWLSPFD